MTVLLGSLLLRPYVFGFLLAFLLTAVRDIGGRRTALFFAWVWPVAFVAEFSSTRTGIPFGLYHYTQATRGLELFISDVPFFDSLSFTFLAYASFCLARVAIAREGRPWLTGGLVAALAGALMMLLDVVIDPLAVRGDRWFLGHIFWYPNGGAYFGVPLSNFAGWFLVGLVGVGGYMLLAGARWGPGRAASTTRARAGVSTGRPWPGVGLYYGVLFFNLSLTAWIGEWSLFSSGLTLHILVALALIAAAYRLRTPEGAMSSSASLPSAGFARAILTGGRQGGASRKASDDRRKGGEAPLRG